MEYDCKRNVWKLVESLPEEVMSVTSGTVWRDRILLSVSSSSPSSACKNAAFYLYRPPTERAAKRSENDWVAIENGDEYNGFVQTAVTLDIGIGCS